MLLVFASIEWLQEEDLHALVREFCLCWSTLEGDLSPLQKVFVTGKCDDAEVSVKVRRGEYVAKVNGYEVFRDEGVLMCLYLFVVS